MNVKIRCRPEKKEEYQKLLEKAGFIIDENSSLTLIEDDFDYSYLIGELEEQYHLIPYQEIIYIESFDHLLICHTLNADYRLKERLYEMEEALKHYHFIRINKSQIINVKEIKKIQPQLNYRLSLTLKNQQVVYVSRNYYQEFKRFIGL